MSSHLVLFFVFFILEYTWCQLDILFLVFNYAVQVKIAYQAVAYVCKLDCDRLMCAISSSHFGIQCYPFRRSWPDFVVSCGHCLYLSSPFRSITCILFHSSIFLHSPAQPEIKRGGRN